MLNILASEAFENVKGGKEKMQEREREKERKKHEKELVTYKRNAKGKTLRQ